MQQFDLGTIKFRLQVSEDGQISASIDVLYDVLAEMFPINTAKKNEFTAADYDKYVQEVLSQREKFIASHIAPGTYSALIKITNEDLEKES